MGRLISGNSNLKGGDVGIGAYSVEDGDAILMKEKGVRPAGNQSERDDNNEPESRQKQKGVSIEFRIVFIVPLGIVMMRA